MDEPATTGQGQGIYLLVAHPAWLGSGVNRRLLAAAVEAGGAVGWDG